MTFLPGRKGYRLGMNRDEKRTRPAGRPPEVIREAGRAFVAPTEPGGGTWIGLNDHGVCLALINWYSVNRQVADQAISRGKIIPAAQHSRDDESVDSALSKLMLERTNPFRLIGIFPASRAIREWRWDLQRLTCLKHSWRAQQWISSGFDEHGAQRIRNETFVAACQQKTFGSLEWLRRLHRSHSPASGPFSMCMHRPDAATVSYTEVSVAQRTGKLRYHATAPCHAIPGSSRQLFVTLQRPALPPFQAPPAPSGRRALGGSGNVFCPRRQDSDGQGGEP